VSELIHNFAIDWKLLLAQVVNFFILLYILKRFAYGPLIKMLNTRKAKIEEGLEFRREAEERLQSIDIEKEKILQESRAQGLEVINQATEGAKNQKDQILKDASKKSEVVLEDAKRHIDEEKAKMEEVVYKDARNLIKSGLIRVIEKIPPDARSEELIRDAIRELKSARSS